MAETVGDSEKARASAWFAELRDRVCAAFEALEDAQDAGPFAALPAGRFERSETRRGGEDAGGGVMAVMREGRVFEKVGVNVSTVHGRLGEAAQREPDRAAARSPAWPRTRASGPRASASSRTCARR